ncbi:MAG: ABC transporter permease subunit, partial [Candidatus Eisenbacteria bacterium]
AVIVMGAGLVHKELDKRTIYLILSKPVPRHQFILGKFLGMAHALFAIVALMLVALELTLLVSRQGVDLVLLKAGLLTYVELLVMTSIAVLFSAFSSTALSAVLTFSVYVVGHFTADLLAFAERFPSAFARYVCQFMYYVIPDLELFNVRGLVVHGGDVSPDRMLAAVAYGLLYATGALALSAAVFSKRDFK